MIVPWMRATVALALLVVIGGGALVAGCGGDDIRCYAPDESACGIPSATDADAAADSATDADARGADVGDADTGEGG